MMVIVGSVVTAAIAAARQIWFLVPVCLVFGLLIWLLMRAAPVLEALRLAPGRVKKIAHRETSDSKRMFVTHWIEIISDEGRIFVRADDDWRPQAILERGE